LPPSIDGHWIVHPPPDLLILRTPSSTGPREGQEPGGVTRNESDVGEACLSIYTPKKLLAVLDLNGEA